jgi:hypothetical protein
MERLSRELNRLRGEFVATSVRIEATLRRILVVYLDLPPDREEVFSEMFFDRITLGALVDDAKVLLRDERLAERFGDVGPMLRRAVEHRNRWVHQETWVYGDAIRGDELDQFTLVSGARKRLEFSASEAEAALADGQTCIARLIELDSAVRGIWGRRHKGGVWTAPDEP